MLSLAWRKHSGSKDRLFIYFLFVCLFVITLKKCNESNWSCLLLKRHTVCRLSCMDNYIENCLLLALIMLIFSTSCSCCGLVMQRMQILNILETLSVKEDDALHFWRTTAYFSQSGTNSKASQNKKGAGKTKQDQTLQCNIETLTGLKCLLRRSLVL